MRVGLIGVGHIGTAVARGLMASGLPAADIRLAPRGAGVAALAAAGAGVMADAAAVVAASDVVLLAVRPPQARAAVAGLPWRPEQLLISFCAGVPIATLAQAGVTGTIARAMPMVAAAHRASPTILFPDEPRARSLLERVGSVVVLAREAEMAPATVAGVLYAAAHGLVGATAEWLATQGVKDEVGRALAAALLEAAGKGIRADPEADLEAMVRSFATPGGISEAAFARLDPDGMRERWQAAYDAGLARMHQIARRS